MRVVVLGSTGSIGVQTLEICDVIHAEVVGISANERIDILYNQAKKFKPKYIGVRSDKIREVREIFGNDFVILDYRELAEVDDCDIVVCGIPGFASVEPFWKAVLRGKKVLVASKEAILCTGRKIFEIAKKNGGKIIPIDSEHSSLWRIIEKYPRERIKEVMITSSGGAFFRKSKEEMENAKPEDATQHPVWNMGKKITVDSSTLMNKAFEVIEASYLFSIPPHMIKVYIHPEALIHAGIKLSDGNWIFSAHYPDMKVPILYGIFYPEIPDEIFPLPSPLKSMSFFEVDLEKFPALSLGYEVLNGPEGLSIVLVSADDFAVSLFLQGKIKLTDIFKVVKFALDEMRNKVSEPQTYIDIEKIWKETYAVLRKYFG